MRSAAWASAQARDPAAAASPPSSRRCIDMWSAVWARLQQGEQSGRDCCMVQWCRGEQAGAAPPACKLHGPLRRPASHGSMMSSQSAPEGGHPMLVPSRFVCMCEAHACRRCLRCGRLSAPCCCRLYCCSLTRLPGGAAAAGRCTAARRKCTRSGCREREERQQWRRRRWRRAVPPGPG